MSETTLSRRWRRLAFQTYYSTVKLAKKTTTFSAKVTPEQEVSALSLSKLHYRSISVSRCKKHYNTLSILTTNEAFVVDPMGILINRKFTLLLVAMTLIFLIFNSR